MLRKVSDCCEEVLHERLQLLLWNGLTMERRLSSVRILPFDLEHKVNNPIPNSAQELLEFVATNLDPRAPTQFISGNILP